jgi:hypothetical protein
MTEAMSSHMKWHHEGRLDDGVMRHPADSKARRGSMLIRNIIRSSQKMLAVFDLALLRMDSTPLGS